MIAGYPILKSKDMNGMKASGVDERLAEMAAVQRFLNDSSESANSSLPDT